MTAVNFIFRNQPFLKARNPHGVAISTTISEVTCWVTPTGVFSFIPPLWTGSISDKEIVKNAGLIDRLEEGDAVMADKGFLVRDLYWHSKRLNLFHQLIVVVQGFPPKQLHIHVGLLPLGLMLSEPYYG